MFIIHRCKTKQIFRLENHDEDSISQNIKTALKLHKSQKFLSANAIEEKLIVWSKLL